MVRELAALLILFATAVPASAAVVPAEPGQVVTQTFDGVSYYSGGAGIEERQALPQRFPMKIVFKVKEGNLLCNADVTITAKGKTVFRGRAENGPWLFVDLPPGSYDIKAVQDGSEKIRKHVKLAAKKRRTVVLTWKSKDVDMGL